MGEPVLGHVDLVYPSKYVKAADLNGKDVTVKIVKVEWETLVMRGNKKERKPVMTMASKSGKVLGKTLVLNKTNLKQIGKTIGEKKVERWPGHEITIYPTTDHFGREVVECIRVRVRTNAQTTDVPEDMAQEPEKAPEFDPGDEGPQ